MWVGLRQEESLAFAKETCPQVGSSILLLKGLSWKQEVVLDAGTGSSLQEGRWEELAIP